MEKGWVVLAAVISGFSVFLNKFGVAGIDPVLFATMKNVLVAIAVLTLTFALKDAASLKRLQRSEWVRLVLVGLVGGAIPFALFFTGLSMTAASSAALVQKTLFLWVGIGAVLFLREKIDWWLGAAAAFLFAGNLFLLRLHGWSFGAGELLILIATLLWAGETLLSKRLLETLPSRIVVLGRMGFGSVFLIAWLLVAGKVSLVTTLNASALGWVLLTSALLVAYVLTFYEGLKRTSASFATTVLLVAAAITGALEMLWTGVWSAPLVVGSLLVLGGLVLAMTRVVRSLRASQAM